MVPRDPCVAGESCYSFVTLGSVNDRRPMIRIPQIGRTILPEKVARPTLALGLMFAIGTTGAGPALGEEFPIPPDPTAPMVDWSGLYFGAHAGAGAFTGRAVDSEDTIFDGPEGDFDLNGFAGLGGVQAGFNYQVGSVVYGLEGDFAWTGYGMDRFAGDPLEDYVKARMRWLATLRARLGVVSGNGMAYVTGGVALAHLEHCANQNVAFDPPCSIDNTDDIAWDGVVPGLAAGMGVEAALADNWSLKAEYLFVQTAVENQVYETANNRDIDFSNRSHQLRVGLNFQPNGVPAAMPEHSGAWSGLYGGVHAGVGAFTGRAVEWDENIFQQVTGDIDLNGFAGIGGAQAGYNYRVGNVVYGVEGDFAWTGYSLDRTFDFEAGTGADNQYVRAEADWQASLRVRLGLASGNAMAYVTGGLAAMYLSHCANFDAPCSTDNVDDISWDGTVLGLAAGAGVEARLSNHWALKAEYLYVGTDEKNVDYAPAVNNDIDFSNRSHQYRLGLNYYFAGLPYEDPEPATDWRGIYAGLHAGAGAFSGQAIDWDDDAINDNDGDADLAGIEPLGGVQAGYNLQTGNVVYGVEADFTATGFDENDTGRLGSDWRSAEMDWLATMRARLGMVSGNAMFYVTGGLAAAHLSHCLNDNDPPCSVDGDDGVDWSGVLLGLAAGAGAEAQLTDHWSLKGEYLFVQMDKENVVYDTTGDQDVDLSNRSYQFRMGLNYRFGGSRS